MNGRRSDGHVRRALTMLLLGLTFTTTVLLVGLSVHWIRVRGKNASASAVERLSRARQLAFELESALHDLLVHRGFLLEPLHSPRESDARHFAGLGEALDMLRFDGGDARRYSKASRSLAEAANQIVYIVNTDARVHGGGLVQFNALAEQGVKIRAARAKLNGPWSKSRFRWTSPAPAPTRAMSRFDARL